jgi:hypothetical protein
MERKNLILFSLFGLLAITVACGKSSTASEEIANSSTASTKAEPGKSAPPTEPNAVPPIKGIGPTPATDTPPPNLIGVYILSEVQHNGQVTMVPADYSTEFTFLADGAYTRESKSGGRVTHTDTGHFSVEGKDQLILKIELSDKKIQIPPVEKTHTITISSDGEELTMKSKDGKVATFRRKRAPKGQ